MIWPRVYLPLKSTAAINQALSVSTDGAPRAERRLMVGIFFFFSWVVMRSLIGISYQKSPRGTAEA